MADHPFARDLGYLHPFLDRLQAHAAALPPERAQALAALLEGEAARWRQIEALLAGDGAPAPSADAETADAETADAETADAETADAETVGPRSVGPRSVGPRSVGSLTVGSLIR